MQNNKEALRYADEAVKREPQDPDFLYLRGIINNSIGKYGKALDDFTDALESARNEELYKLYLNRGVAYFNVLEYESAMSDFHDRLSLMTQWQVHTMEGLCWITKRKTLRPL